MSLHDHSVGGELIFAAEAAGTVFRLQSLELYNDEDEDKPDVPEGDVFGNWVKVLDVDDETDKFMAAPGELIEELQRHAAEPGDKFRVTRCEKSGSAQTDPYEVNVESLEDQERL